MKLISFELHFITNICHLESHLFVFYLNSFIQKSIISLITSALCTLKLSNVIYLYSAYFLVDSVKTNCFEFMTFTSYTPGPTASDSNPGFEFENWIRTVSPLLVSSAVSLSFLYPDKAK